MITNDLRVAIVDAHWSKDKVEIRYHSSPWPFPEWDVKTRRQLTEVKVQYEYEDALF